MSTVYNLVGQPLNSEVKAQLTKRSEALSQFNRNETAVTFIANSNAWIKLTSLVDVNESSDLAKAWVLHGGVRGYGKQPKTGFESYTFGASSNPLQELGVRPMPGVTSATIEVQGRGGAFRVANIQIRANNLDQLDVLDTLFFKLGFACVLEWGHSTYINNSGVFIQADWNDQVEAFSVSNRQAVIQNIDRLKRKCDGNYDGMLGLITNYTWQATEDGGYNCTLKLTGTGAIADSIKINQVTGGAKDNPISTVLSQNKETTPQPSSTLQAVLQNIATIAMSGSFTTSTHPIQYVGAAENFWSTANWGADNYLSKLGTGYFDGSNDDFNHGFNAGRMVSGLQADKVDLKELEKILIVTYKVGANYTTTTVTISKSNTPYAYVKLGFFLALINTCATLYHQEGNNKKTTVYIDFNTETNLCYTNEYHASIEPRVCLIPPPFNTGTSTVEKILGVNGLTESDLTAAATALAVLNIDRTEENAFSKGVDKYNFNSFRKSTNKGRLMEIMVSVDYLIERLKAYEQANSDGNVLLTSFLEGILSDIQKALGNVNNFKVAVEDNCVRIYDDQLLEKNKIPELPVFGYRSIAKQFTVQSETSTKIGHTLAITAQSPDSLASSDSRTNIDGSSLASLHRGLRERTAQKPTTAANDQKTPELLQAAYGFREFYIRFYSAFYNTVTTADFWSPLILDYFRDQATNFYISSLNLLKTKGTVRGKNLVMPIACRLTLPGISTPRLYEAFTVEGNRLPRQYKDSKGEPTVGFTISGLSHTIQSNTWTTEIKGQMINIEDTVALVPPASAPPPAASSGAPPPNVAPGNCPSGYQDLSKTFNNPRKKKLIVQYGWPVEMHPNTNYTTGPFCARVASGRSYYNTYYKNPTYAKQLVKKTYNFTGGGSFNVQTLPIMLNLLDQAYAAIEAADLGAGVLQWGAPYYPRDVKKQGSKGSLSGHAFAIAIDVNYGPFPDQTPVSTVVAAANQTADITRQKAAKVLLTMKDLKDSNGKKLFAWGGTYISPPDVMHFTPVDFAI